ncbi:MAG: acyl-CoA dehydrogenase family protein [Gammaproteobacteria bacterium]
MNFQWTTEHEAYRGRIRDLLRRHLPPDWGAQSRYDNGSDFTVAFSRRFCPILAAEGLLIPHWPREYGGGGLDAWHHWILNEEMWAEGEPRAYQYMSINWVGPAFIRFGTPAQKDLHLKGITSGTISYCQGFSEPNAGSDLAALRTRAEHRGGAWIIEGSKIWTSAASFADYCILLARTGGSGRGGISVFVVPMNLPGITVRVIPSLQGARAMHEVFFDAVELPADGILGEPNKGWEVVTQILAHERIGAPRYALTWRGLDRAMELLAADGRIADPEIRARAARCEAALNAAKWLALQVIGGRVQGRPADAETNVARYAAVCADRTVCEFIGDFLSEHLFPEREPLLAAAYKRTASIGIAAGAAEVQLNLIARNLLHMPRES